MIAIKEERLLNDMYHTGDKKETIYDFYKSDFFNDLIKDVGYIFDEWRDEYYSASLSLRSRNNIVSTVFVGKTKETEIHLVNGEDIKGQKDRSFSGIGTHIEYSYIPENQLWISGRDIEQWNMPYEICRSLIKKCFIEKQNKSNNEAVWYANFFVGYLVVAPMVNSTKY